MAPPAGGRRFRALELLVKQKRLAKTALVPCVVRERRAGDPPILVADPSKSESGLGFKASRSDLGHIIRSAWAWHQKAHPRRR